MNPQEKNTVRLDTALVQRGLASSRNRAARLVHDGHVHVNGTVVSKPSWPTHVTDDIIIQGNSNTWVSRAALKLVATLDALGHDIALAGKRALDIGASTGGFTEVLLSREVDHVIALDVGHDQLVPRLRTEPRVTVIEGYNARHLQQEDLPYIPNLVVADVSFISLTKIIPALTAAVSNDADIILMVKPQFEVARNEIRQGVVHNPEAHCAAIRRVLNSALEHGLCPQALVPSVLPGPQGNREYFVWLRPASHSDDWSSSNVEATEKNFSQAIAAAVDFAQSLHVYGTSVPDGGLIPSSKRFSLTRSDT
ncbi:TlyA family RNA methyltransferase [Jonesia quinghaiensis]|uniref:TlyA family RNA methyltransferase n=1 Tax=Jonesia quinghaiensis TaxID=262806 RepID=UPI0009FE2DEA|nr:TlyA family RNA methyltransferase [Jonesia quinghaiensis]